MTSSELITAAQGLLTDFGVLPLIFASAIIALGAFLLRRVRSASR